MKKIILSITTILMLTSLVGCNGKNNSEINELNKKIDELHATIDSLEERITELSENDNKLVSDLKSYKSVKETTPVKITKSYLPNLEGYDELIESFKEKFKGEGKTVIYPEKAVGDRVIILRTSEAIKNVKLNKFNNRFITEFGCDEEIYFRECGIDNGEVLADVLNSNEALVFTAIESEGIPSYYLSWTEKDGTTVYSSIIYDGKGDVDQYE